MQLSIVLATKKSMPFGKTRAIVPFEVKGGARYKLELLANITIPEIKIEDNPEAVVDFGKVLCGKRKTVFLRLLNQKEIPCEWALTSRESMIDKKSEESWFLLNPSSGKILPSCNQIIEVSFTPSSEKPYQHKFPIKIT